MLGAPRVRHGRERRPLAGPHHQLVAWAQMARPASTKGNEEPEGFWSRGSSPGRGESPLYWNEDPGHRNEPAAKGDGHARRGRGHDSRSDGDGGSDGNSDGDSDGNSDGSSDGDSDGDFDDALFGGRGDDFLVGGDGADRVQGGRGDDTLDGGAGDDDLIGGRGDDVAVYVAGDNEGDHDVYHGGRGTDALRLELTETTWRSDAVRGEVVRFLDSLTPQGTDGVGTFTFSVFELTVAGFETLELVVDGQAVDPAAGLIVAANDAYALGENDLLSGDVIANDEVPIAVQAVNLVSGPMLGTLTLNGDGTFNYDPGDAFDALAADEVAVDSFVYAVVGTNGDTGTATAALTVEGANDAPVAQADTARVAADQSLTLDVLANDTDVDQGDGPADFVLTGAALAGVVDPAATASVAIIANQLLFDPGADFDGLLVGQTATAVVDYTMTDASGAVATAQATITVDGVAQILASAGDDVRDLSTLDPAGFVGDPMLALDGNDAVTLPGADSAYVTAGAYDPQRTFDAGAGNDTITGGDLDDHVLGGVGSDLLDGGGGGDRLMSMASSAAIVWPPGIR